jgi:hypothetical protein
MGEAAMGYSICQELTPDRWSITFECDPQSRAALLRDFPWLRNIRVPAREDHHPRDDERKRRPQSNSRAR